MELTCKNCGEKFIQTRGRARNYCYKPECSNIDKGNKVIKIHEKKESEIETLKRLSKVIGDARKELIEMIKEINPKVYEADKVEIDLLHKLEMTNDAAEISRIAYLIKSNREQRRETKNAQYLIQSFLDCIKCNPEDFVQKGIEMSKNYTYEPRILKELFEEGEDKHED